MIDAILINPTQSQADSDTDPSSEGGHASLRDWVRTDVGFRLRKCDGICNGCESIVTIGGGCCG